MDRHNENIATVVLDLICYVIDVLISGFITIILPRIHLSTCVFLYEKNCVLFLNVRFSICTSSILFS